MTEFLYDTWSEQTKCVNGKSKARLERFSGFCVTPKHFGKVTFDVFGNRGIAKPPEESQEELGRLYFWDTIHSINVLGTQRLG